MYPYQSKMFMTNMCKYSRTLSNLVLKNVLKTTICFGFLRSYCEREGMKPLSTADFGKVMKQIFPSLRPRRLGTRGNSRYCYAAMRKTTKLDCPLLPNLNDRKRMHESNAEFKSNEDDSSYDSNGAWSIIKTWAESILKKDFSDAKQLAEHITSQQKDIVSHIEESPDWMPKKGNQKQKLKASKITFEFLSESVTIYYMHLVIFPFAESNGRS